MATWPHPLSNKYCLIINSNPRNKSKEIVGLVLCGPCSSDKFTFETRQRLLKAIFRKQQDQESHIACSAAPVTQRFKEARVVRL